MQSWLKRSYQGEGIEGGVRETWDMRHETKKDRWRERERVLTLWFFIASKSITMWWKSPTDALVNCFYKHTHTLTNVHIDPSICVSPPPTPTPAILHTHTHTRALSCRNCTKSSHPLQTNSMTYWHTIISMKSLQRERGREKRDSDRNRRERGDRDREREEEERESQRQRERDWSTDDWT